MLTGVSLYNFFPSDKKFAKNGESLGRNLSSKEGIIGMKVEEKRCKRGVARKRVKFPLSHAGKNGVGSERH